MAEQMDAGAVSAAQPGAAAQDGAAPAPKPKRKYTRRAITMAATGMRMWPEELALADKLALEDERSTSAFLRRMALIGMRHYQAATATMPAAVPVAVPAERAALPEAALTCGVATA